MRKRYSRSYTVLSFLTMFSYRELPLWAALFMCILPKIYKTVEIASIVW